MKNKVRKPSIVFVIDTYARKPTGGTKVIYQYANNFYKFGYNVTIVYSIKNPFESTQTLIPYWFRYFVQWAMIHNGSSWFKLRKGIKFKYITNINESTIPDTNIIFATTVGTAEPIANLTSNKGKKFF